MNLNEKEDSVEVTLNLPKVENGLDAFSGKIDYDQNKLELVKVKQVSKKLIFWFFEVDPVNFVTFTVVSPVTFFLTLNVKHTASTDSLMVLELINKINFPFFSLYSGVFNFFDTCFL